MATRSWALEPGLDALDERRRRRRLWQRVGIPIGCVALMAAAMLAIALYADQANRQGVLALSDDTLTTLEGRITLTVAGYLDPVARAASIARDLLHNDRPADRQAFSETYGALVLDELPQAAIVSFADDDGSYLMVRRGAGGGVDIKVIDNAPSARRVTWIHRNAQGQAIGREVDQTDDFDPRQRPWYVGAVAADGLFWTAPYIFYTDRQPGITVAIPDRDPDGRRHVYGVDITLAALSNILGTLRIGRSGRAVIIDDSGRLVAAPPRLLQSLAGQAVGEAHVDQLGDPILTRAYDQYRIEGYGHRIVEIGARRYIFSATALGSSGRDWSILAVVPEDEFTGFVAANQRHALILSLGILAVALVMALLMIRHGLRADRAARQLLERQRTIARQSTAFADLAVDAGLFDPAQGEPPRRLTQTLAEATEARRTGIWRLTAGGQILRCEDIFDRDTSGHVEGLELHRDELPQLFSHLMQGAEIDAPDAAADQRTAEAHHLIMKPLGSRALLIVPVLCNHKTVGAVWLEDALPSSDTRDFARAVANMLAFRMGDSPRPQDQAERALIAEPPPAPEAPESRDADLLASLAEAEAPAEVYPAATIMVLEFSDPIAMALQPPGAKNLLCDELSRSLQEIAALHNISYLKIIGQQVIAATGLGPGDPAAAQRIAEVALSARDRCAQLFDRVERAYQFRIGVDCGMAIGTNLGSEPRLFNLWGEAVTTAEAMTTSALPGTIQATEAAYRHLRHKYLLRPRGRFYLPRLGEARTYVLAGRL
jgi:class 3 adenylate cyclase/GAF domain-containing protein